MRTRHALGFVVAALLARGVLADAEGEIRTVDRSPGAKSQPMTVAAAQEASPQTGGETGASAQQIEELQKQVQELKERLDKMAAEPSAGAPAAKPPGKPKGTVEIYGHVDVSVDAATKGIAGRSTLPASPTCGGPGSPPTTACDGRSAVGALGWMPAIASNSSYFGVRGGLALDEQWRVVFQIETQVDVAATPGVAGTNFHDDAIVRGAFASRNSFLGFTGPFGSIKAGKNDSPYYTSTRRFDAFYGTVGTYTSIMANSGGDNRVEFATRLSHAIWYESPNLGGFSFAAMVSPGQNRNEDNLIQAQGEPNCTGGYAPTALQLYFCNDGAWGTAYSVNAAYDRGGLYATAAWELHQNVNRTVDEFAYGGLSPDGSIAIANEYAWKVGLMYDFPTKTRLGGIYEQLHRHNPWPNQDYNERDRDGFWVTGTQKLSQNDEVSLGWAHAGKTPGDVGTRRSDGTFQSGPVENSGNMYTAGVWHHFLDGNPTLYLVYAAQVNTNGAHYDLGAGSHGIQYDCHDGNPLGSTTAVGTLGAGGRCWTGATLQAVTFGATYNF